MEAAIHVWERKGREVLRVFLSDFGGGDRVEGDLGGARSVGFEDSILLPLCLVLLFDCN